MSVPNEQISTHFFILTLHSTSKNIIIVNEIVVKVVKLLKILVLWLINSTGHGVRVFIVLRRLRLDLLSGFAFLLCASLMSSILLDGCQIIVEFETGDHGFQDILELKSASLNVISLIHLLNVEVSIVRCRQSGKGISTEGWDALLRGVLFLLLGFKREFLGSNGVNSADLV